jgi:dihydroneopterin aldolase
MTALPGSIVIRGLRCRGRQGPTAADQQQAHDYLVDVELSLDVADAVERDERVTADVGRALLERFPRVTKARVKVEKPEPDGLDAAAEAVELTLSR